MSSMMGGIATLLPLLVFLKGVSTTTAACACHRDDFTDVLEGVHDDLIDIFVSTRHREIHCCAKGLLEEPGSFYNITWKHNGQAYPWKSITNSSLLMKDHCSETLYTNYATKSDAGNYTCTITTANRTMVHRTYKIRVLASDTFREKPILSLLTPDVLTLPRKNVTLTCRAYFGRVSNMGGFGNTIVWRRAFDNGSIKFASEMTNADVREIREKNGMITSKFHLSELSPSDYGSYSCKLNNAYGSVTNNVSITYGLPHHEHLAVTFRAWLLVVVFVFMLLATILCVWCRCRTVLHLYYKENLAPLPPKGDYKWDVMVVHGDDASGWVWKSFVPRLEDTHGYSCFLPERDLCGGQMVAETVAEIVGQCGRVVLVVTKGLLESPMAVWALHQSVHAVLTTKAKMIAVVIEDITKVKSSGTNGLVGMLKVVRKLHWPGPWSSEVNDDDDMDEEVFEEADMMDQEKPKGKESKKNKKKRTKKMKNNNNTEKNINNQKVSNMVSAYNKENLDSLEDLDKGMKPLRPTRLYIDSLEQASTSEPGSPDSQAPFIMPSVSSDTRNKVGCWELIRTGYTLDPIEIFWQKLRLYLLHPNKSRGIPRKEIDKL